jgi:hypothetical protein
MPPVAAPRGIRYGPSTPANPPGSQPRTVPTTIEINGPKIFTTRLSDDGSVFFPSSITSRPLIVHATKECVQFTCLLVKVERTRRETGRKSLRRRGGIRIHLVPAAHSQRGAPNPARSAAGKRDYAVVLASPADVGGKNSAGLTLSGRDMIRQSENGVYRRYSMLEWTFTK